MVLIVDGHKVVCGLAWFKTWQGMLGLLLASLVGLFWSLFDSHFEKKHIKKYGDIGGML